MFNLQEIVSIATLVVLAINAWITLRILVTIRAARIAPMRQLEPELEYTTSRGVLPMSSLGVGGHIPQIFVFDEGKGAFRRVGNVNADGQAPDDSCGDGISFVKGKLYRIVGRPQRAAFKPERICIGSGTTPNGASDWNVHDIAVGHRSQLAQSGVLPGDMFASDAIDAFVSFDTVQTAMDFSLDVSYIGPNASEPFTCSVIGTEARYSA